MNPPPSTLSSADGSTLGSDERRQAAEAARRVAERWERTGTADLPAALATEPAILEDRSVFFDLAEREYRLNRSEWGGRTASEYCQRFPELEDGLRHSLRRLIEVEQQLGSLALDQLVDVPDEIEWPVAGQLFGKFYISRELGRGSAGRVFLCRQSSLGDRPIVLKVSPSIQAEAATLGQLSHPNVVPVHDADTDPDSGLGWISMPYLGDRTLQDAIAGAFIDGIPKTDLLKTPLPRSRPTRARELHERVVLRLFADLADGLHYVHEREMLHGDLKPSNVLLTDEGVPMLIDFNLARGATTDATVLGGTLPYMAPEQLAAISDEADPHNLSSATDVFSFGVTLHHALTGKPPFQPQGVGKGLVENARAMLASQAAWRADGAPTLAGVDEPIARLVRECLVGPPAERPHGFASLRDSLRRLHSPAFHGWRFVARRPKSSASTATVGLAAAIGVATIASTHSAARTLQTAGRLADEQRHDEAVALLQPYVENHPADAKAHRVLGNSLLDRGEPKSAASHYMRAWQADGQPLDIAMVGYCNNLLKDHTAAISPYREAEKLRPWFYPVLHNRAASLLFHLEESFDSDRSREIEKLLKQAWSLAPDNETIRLAMLRHHDSTVKRKATPPVYPIEIATFPTNQNLSFDFCRSAAWFVARRAVDEQELMRYGVPCLQRMVDLRGPDALAPSLGKEVASVYEPLISDLSASRTTLPEPPIPPFFLDPREE